MRVSQDSVTAEPAAPAVGFALKLIIWATSGVAVTTGVAVAVGVAVTVGDGVSVLVAVAITRVGVAVAVMVAVEVRDAVGVTDGRLVLVGRMVMVGVMGSGVGDAVAVRVGVGVFSTTRVGTSTTDVVCSAHAVMKSGTMNSVSEIHDRILFTGRLQKMIMTKTVDACLRYFTLLMIACWVAACQPTSVPSTVSLPTRITLPTNPPLVTVTPLPTRVLRTVATNTSPAAALMQATAGSGVPATPLVLEPALLTGQPTLLPSTNASAAALVTPIFTPFVQSGAAPLSGPPAAPLNSAAPVVVTPTLPQSAPALMGDLSSFVTSTDYIFGTSVQGRSLVARVIGEGEVSLMLVGSVHGGWEANTAQLVSELIAYFEATPEDVLPGMRLILIPVLNPDGLVLGRTLEGRFNANGVDLNRNWGCDWQPNAVFRDTPVNPGLSAFSEPETVALAAYIIDVRPAVVLFYHSAANGIFAGDCPNSGISDEMSAIYGQAASYSYGAAFSSYPVTGTAATWVDGIGIPSADVELQTSDATDFERNLAGVMRLQCWLLGAAAAELPQCAVSQPGG